MRSSSFCFKDTRQSWWRWCGSKCPGVKRIVPTCCLPKIRDSASLSHFTDSPLKSGNNNSSFCQVISEFVIVYPRMVSRSCLLAVLVNGTNDEARFSHLRVCWSIFLFSLDHVPTFLNSIHVGVASNPIWLLWDPIRSAQCYHHLYTHFFKSQIDDVRN